MSITQVIVIPEPHLWDRTFKNRRDYPGEIEAYLEEVLLRVEQLPGEKIIIFPGDIFHHGYTSIAGVSYAFSLFARMNKLTNNRVFSVVGNHELTYRSNNPFWMMASDETNRFGDMQGLSGYGVVHPGIQIVDTLSVGPLDFVLGHFSRREYVPTHRDCVLITHNALTEPEISKAVNAAHKTESIDEYLHVSSLLSEEAMPVTEYLKYVFIGHMHTYYSSFDVDEMVNGVHMQFFLQYLGSLGRTSVAEINDCDLKRTIPVFTIDGNSYDYAPFTVMLKGYDEIVLQDVVRDNKEKYQAQRAIKELRESNVFGDTPLSCIERELQKTPDMLALFSRVYHGSIDSEIQELIREAQL